jgi:tetraacyldisaccharide 4'-kinase
VPPLIQKIETAIRSEKRARFFSIETLLQGLSAIYGTLAQIKNAAFNRKILLQRQLPCVVISIGNITVGGTGKTPMTIYVANLITSLGYRVAILSRGYKGHAEKTGGIVTDGKTLLMSPVEAGDEPYMMAGVLKGVPILVGRNRYEAGNRALSVLSPNVILLDDGFQHLKLARDIDLVLVDHSRPFGNGHLLPRGPLREPVSALKRADIILETRCDGSKKPGVELAKTMQRLSLKTPVFQSGHELHIAQVIPGLRTSLADSGSLGQSHYLSILKGKRVVAFSGLANNRNFHRTLIEIGCDLAGVKEFPDHYWYRESDLGIVQQSAIERQAELILTTEKDVVRIPNGIQWPLDLVVIGITPCFGNQTDALKNDIRSRLLMGKPGVRHMRPLKLIAVMDGRLGHEKQTRGIIEALEEQTPLEIQYSRLPTLSMASDIKSRLAYLKSFIRFGSSATTNRQSIPKVDLLIGTGYHTHFPLLLLKKKTGARVVTCMTPDFPLKGQMDLCCIPRHDCPRMTANVFITTGPPSTARAGNRHDPGKGLILVGGVDEKSHFWNTRATIEQIKTIIRKHPDRRWTVSSSPRTPEDTLTQLETLKKTEPMTFFFRSADTPPGWIEAQYNENRTTWVTADSISMVYEALTAGCQVGILPIRWKNKDNKFQRSIDDLVLAKRANTYERWVAGEELPTPASPLNEAARCANEILRRWWPERLTATMHTRKEIISV